MLPATSPCSDLELWPDTVEVKHDTQMYMLTSSINMKSQKVESSKLIQSHNFVDRCGWSCSVYSNTTKHSLMLPPMSWSSILCLYQYSMPGMSMSIFIIQCLSAFLTQMLIFENFISHFTKISFPGTWCKLGLPNRVHAADTMPDAITLLHNNAHDTSCSSQKWFKLHCVSKKHPYNFNLKTR